MDKRNTIEIPLKGKDQEVLEVDLDEIQGNESAIINVLTQESARPGLFLQFAV